MAKLVIDLDDTQMAKLVIDLDDTQMAKLVIDLDDTQIELLKTIAAKNKRTMKAQAEWILEGKLLSPLQEEIVRFSDFSYSNGPFFSTLKEVCETVNSLSGDPLCE